MPRMSRAMLTEDTRTRHPTPPHPTPACTHAVEQLREADANLLCARCHVSLRMCVFVCTRVACVCVCVGVWVCMFPRAGDGGFASIIVLAVGVHHRAYFQVYYVRSSSPASALRPGRARCLAERSWKRCMRDPRAPRVLPRMSLGRCCVCAWVTCAMRARPVWHT